MRKTCSSSGKTVSPHHLKSCSTPVYWGWLSASFEMSLIQELISSWQMLWSTPCTPLLISYRRGSLDHCSWNDSRSLNLVFTGVSSGFWITYLALFGQLFVVTYLQLSEVPHCYLRHANSHLQSKFPYYVVISINYVIELYSWTSNLFLFHF
jgi:hypothetical protein